MARRRIPFAAARAIYQFTFLFHLFLLGRNKHFGDTLAYELHFTASQGIKKYWRSTGIGIYWTTGSLALLNIGWCCIILFILTFPIHLPSYGRMDSLIPDRTRHCWGPSTVSYHRLVACRLHIPWDACHSSASRQSKSRYYTQHLK